MRTAAIFSLLLLATSANPANAGPSVLVELFTAQGCGPCGEANAQIGKLTERSGVLGLTFSVDYWDYLGWTDTFAQAAFAERQKAYVSRLKLREPYTPQVFVDGRREVQGLKSAEIDKAVRLALDQPHDAPDIRFVGDRRADVGSGRAPRGGVDVWLIRYQPGAAETQVKAGDNRGQTVTEINVVREMTRLGSWRGRPQAYRLPAPADRSLRTVVLVQGAKGGRILGFAAAKAPPVS